LLKLDISSNRIAASQRKGDLQCICAAGGIELL
jgi:hypothetical protein